jgi:addiction module HigA family antidote
MTNNRKKRPTHPGEILREDVLPAAALTQDKLARLLGGSRRTISEILHERRPVTTDMACRWRAPLARRQRCGLVYSRMSISGTLITLATRNTKRSDESEPRTGA